MSDSLVEENQDWNSSLPSSNCNKRRKKKRKASFGGVGGVNLHRLGLNNLILLIKASNLKSQSISVIHFFSLANNGIKQKNKKPLI